MGPRDRPQGPPLVARRPPTRRHTVRVGSLRLGDVEVGVRAGTAAWLDVSAGAGKVQNALDPTDAPEPAAATVEIRARTSLGDIVIRRP